jgi:hypothetical protein
VEACIRAGLVGREGFAVDASLIVADANRQRSIPGAEWSKELDPQQANRAAKEYLATLDDAAFGAATVENGVPRSCANRVRVLDGLFRRPNRCAIILSSAVAREPLEFVSNRRVCGLAGSLH